MSAVTVATTPTLRLLPVPVAEPRPALRIVPERGVPAPGESTGRRCGEAPVDRGGRQGPEAGPRQVLPPAAAWTRQFVQTALEAVGGRRPVSQLLRWSNDDVYSLLVRRASLATRLDRAGTATARCAVRSVHLRPLRAGVIEACAVVSDRGRFRAVALRLENAGGRWRVTAFEIG